MIRMTKPENNINSIIRDCTSNFRDAPKRDRFINCIAYIDEYTNLFDSKMLTHDIHKLASHRNVNGILTKEDMVNLYDEKFAKKSQPGRIYYDKIMVSAKGGHCPYCGIRQVSTLDHFLSKTTFPTLAVSPINLIPVCKDCNFIKLDRQITCYTDTPLNPYYDEMEKNIWLEAVILESSDILVSYKVVKPTQWDETMNKRMENHFEQFKLQNLFCLQATDEISSINFRLKKLKNIAGVQALYQELSDMRESCEKVSLNGWKAALYRALSLSAWFVESYI